ncbi:hypothetical protein M407DRAFT_24852 [Tulasnella calospora MUT 4182]|uniref:Protein kinase domain-containing protein n=1 Tax=Tulasnella calospora MUT 4182 TaxID=1051891 RepID=A0A0C3Q7X7_9AGAM|nr:hypothetical protein M407DRAFT_24852 [Tulasnella calospora MUT 4182]
MHTSFHPAQAETLMEDKNRHADAEISRPVRPDRSGSSGRFKPSSKLRARVRKLAGWRIYPSSLIFLEDVCEFSGAHATVSKARMNRREKDPFRKDVHHDINVAVKKVRVADDTDLERALGLAIRESKFLSELDHPNIVELEGFVEVVSKSIIWLIFPWAQNGNLRDFVASVDWEIPETISLIEDVTQGLAYLHSRKPPICHGDLKALNVLVNSKARAEITDFGSARRLPMRDPKTKVASQAQPAQPLNATFCASTNTITLTGNQYTLRWAAPELLMEDELSLESDIWAWGWIAYEVMTDSLPFQDASTDCAVVERVLGGKLPSLVDNARLSLTDELCSLMNMCWLNNPAERPTASACRESIKQMPMFAPDLEASRVSGESGDKTLAVDKLIALGHLYQSRGENARAFDLFVEALASSRRHREQEELVSSLCNLIQFHRLRNEDTESIALHSEMRGFYLKSRRGESKDMVGALCNLAQIHRLQNQYNKNIDLESEGRKAPEEESIVRALCNVADVHRLENQGGEAILLYSKALQIFTELGNRKDRANALRSLAELHRLRHEYDKAVPLYSELLEIRPNLRSSPGRVDALRGLAEMHRLRNDYEKAIPLYSELLEICTDLGDGQGRVGALKILAEMHLFRKEYNKAVPLYSELLEFLPNLRDSQDRVDALSGLAEMYRLRNEYNKAGPLYSELLEIRPNLRSNQGILLDIRTDLGDRKGEADALWNLAEMHRLQEDYEEAIPLYSELFEIRTDLGDRQGRADALWSFAELHRLRNEYNKAIPLYSELLEIPADLSDREGTADVLWGLAEMHRLRDEYKAIPLYSQLLEIRTDLGDRKGRAEALWGLAEMHRLRNEYNKAIPLYSELLEICTDLGDKKGEADALWSLAEVHRLRDDYEKAIPLYSELLEVCSHLDDRKGRADALWGLAELHRLQNEYEKAIPLYSELLEIRSDLGNRKGRADALWSLAEVHRLRNEYNKAIPLYS